MNPYEIALPTTANAPTFLLSASSLSKTLGEFASRNVCKSEGTWKRGGKWTEKSLLEAMLAADEIRCRRDLPEPATVADALGLLEDGFSLVIE